ncbi:MAG: acyltransferase [Planctomycetota bacterium]
MAKRPELLPSLEGLRALAALAVFGVHVEQLADAGLTLGPLRLDQAMKNGRLGVAMFLVLSGYCLARPLWSRPCETRLETTLCGFAKRRFSRIVPLYWIVLTAIWLIQSKVSSLEFSDWLAHCVFVHNFWTATLYSISEPLWAIALIVQYYVFWWLLMQMIRWLRLRSDAAIVGTLAGVLLISWGINASLEVSGVAASLFGEQVWRHGLLIHLPIFTLGSLASWFESRRVMQDSAQWLNALVITGLLLLIIALACFPIELSLVASRYAFPIVPVLFAAVVLSATNEGWLQRVLSSRWLTFGGSISYAFYLVHQPAIQLTERLLRALAFPSSLWQLAVGSLLIAGVVAWTLTFAVEVPMRRLLSCGVSHRNES